MQLSVIDITQYAEDADHDEDIDVNLPYTELTSEEQDTASQAPNIPIILIPGILNHKNEMLKLAEELPEPDPKDYPPIYGYNDEARVAMLAQKLSPSVLARLHSLTLEDHGKWIAQEIRIKNNHPFGPYIIIGFSYGCAEALETAKQLAKQGLDSFLYLLDGPTPGCVRKYLETNDPSTTKDLIEILNATARLYQWKEREFSSEEIEHLQKLALEDRIQCIGDAIKEIQSPDASHAALFTAHVVAITQNLSKLINYSFTMPTEHDEPGKITIHSLTTDVTAQKYKSAHGGWDQLGYNHHEVQHSRLKKMSHLDLVSAPAALHLIAEDIRNIIRHIKDNVLVAGYYPTKLLTTKLIDIVNEAPKHPELKTVFSTMLANAAAQISPEKSSHSRELPASEPLSSREETPTGQRSSWSDEESRLDQRLPAEWTTDEKSSSLTSPGYVSPPSESNMYMGKSSPVFFTPQGNATKRAAVDGMGETVERKRNH